MSAKFGKSGKYVLPKSIRGKSLTSMNAVIIKKFVFASSINRFLIC